MTYRSSTCCTDMRSSNLQSACRLVDDLAGLVFQHAPTFKIADIHMSLWGFAKLQTQVPEDVMRDLALRAMHRCPLSQSVLSIYLRQM